MIDIFAIKWRTLDIKLPDFIAHWLVDNTSLTAKLKHAFPNFSVEVISEKEIELNTQTQELLKVQTAVQREVHLCSSTKKLVYAISLIPKECADLINIGNKPLGEILFESAMRESIEIGRSGVTWGRRSIFVYKNHRIMVCEFFLPQLLDI